MTLVMPLPDQEGIDKGKLLEGLILISSEYLRARRHNAPLNSLSEARGVIDEEVEEMHEAFREKGNHQHKVEEIIQVGAMALAAYVECLSE